MKHRFLASLLLFSVACGPLGAETLQAAVGQDNVPVGQQEPALKKPTIFPRALAG